ncbi:MAG: hypothetical protein LBF60_07485 [Treponema sp.]|nr:hypothetical protein [Treponema sp.]
MRFIQWSPVERMPGRKRHKTRGASPAKPGALLKQQIPVRTFWHWEDKKPGFREIGALSRDGGFAQGGCAFALSLAAAGVGPYAAP